MSVFVWVFKRAMPAEVYQHLEEECWKIRGPNRQVGLRWDHALKFTSCCRPMRIVRGMHIQDFFQAECRCMMCDNVILGDDFKAPFISGCFLNNCYHQRRSTMDTLLMNAICFNCTRAHYHPSPGHLFRITSWDDIICCQADGCSRTDETNRRGSDDRYYCSNHISEI